jgi:hypothetical protein
MQKIIYNYGYYYRILNDTVNFYAVLKWNLQIPRQMAEIQAGDKRPIDLDLLRLLPATPDSDYSKHYECHRSTGRLRSMVPPPCMEFP